MVKFYPSELNFGEQFIGIPKVQSINIINIGSDSLRLESISGSTVHFYCSFFVEKLLPSGANTSFDVYFLARDIGYTESLLFINTNKGIIKYTVNGIGVLNPYRLKPILNARIPLNSSFSSNLVLHNPHNVSIQVVEIYSSDDDLHIELPNIFLEISPLVRATKLKISDLNNNSLTINKEIWVINQN